MITSIQITIYAKGCFVSCFLAYSISYLLPEITHIGLRPFDYEVEMEARKNPEHNTIFDSLAKSGLSKAQRKNKNDNNSENDGTNNKKENIEIIDPYENLNITWMDSLVFLLHLCFGLYLLFGILFNYFGVVLIHPGKPSSNKLSRMEQSLDYNNNHNTTDNHSTTTTTTTITPEDISGNNVTQPNVSIRKINTNTNTNNNNNNNNTNTNNNNYWKYFKKDRFCKKCNTPKPPRCHHCDICGT